MVLLKFMNYAENNPPIDCNNNLNYINFKFCQTGPKSS